MRILLADDHRMMRDALRALLAREGHEVVGEAEDGRDAIAEAKRLRPGLVVIDVAMPLLNGTDATRQIVSELPATKVVALSMNADRGSVVGMLEAGASGYLLKRAAADELLRALQAVHQGEVYLSPAIAGAVVAQLVRRASAPVTAKPALSLREREVLQLLSEGKSSKQIAALLHIALPTVESHRRQIMDKLSLRTIAELTKYAIREGITSVEGST